MTDDSIKQKPNFYPFINWFSKHVTKEEKLFFLFRFGVLGCFVGHGSWGLISKAGWLPFFNVFFIPDNTAYLFMPIIGFLDILVGLVCFIRPNRIILTWALFWTLFTALLRPSAGMGMSEFFERAGNYGVPFAFLFLYGFKNHLTETLSPFAEISNRKLKGLEFILRLSLFSLLAGHGSLALFKLSPLLQNHLNFIGWQVNALELQLIGLAEIIIGLLVFIKPKAFKLVLFVLIWKLAWEIVFPFAGRPIDILETIERMGDFIIPAILLLIYKHWPDQVFSIFP